MSNDLGDIVSELRESVRSGDPSAPLRLAGALGWRESANHVEPLWAPVDGLHTARGFIGADPAALFVTPDRTGGSELTADSALSRSAFAAYHASVNWGALLDEEGVTVFNARWLRNGDWFRLPRLDWEQAANDPQLLRLLDPTSIIEERIDREATKVFAPDDFLRAVDDALVTRLDAWRAEALEIAKEPEGMDAALQRLFAQLFVLRAVEDRRIMAEGIPSLDSVRRGNTVDRYALATIFALAERQIQSELFSDRPADSIPDEVLAGVIRDLYVPFGLPSNAARYNFAWLDVDVLGRAYEKYLSTVLHAGDPVPQVDLFQESRRSVEPQSVRRAGGVYYTPEFLVRSLTAQVFDAIEDIPGVSWRKENVETPPRLVDTLAYIADGLGPPQNGDGDGDRLPVVADFACGSGHFLVAAADLLLRRLRLQDPNRDWPRELVSGRHLIGVDIDPGAVTLTKLNLWIRFAADPRSLPLPALHESIICADSLSVDVWDKLPSRFNAILGNPPFLATGKVAPREELAKRFRTAQGRFDYAHLFVELAATKLATGGVLGLVVPNRVFRNDDANLVREVITENTDLLTIVDFGSAEVFEGVAAYVGTITARRREPTTPESQSVRVVRVHNVEARFLGELLRRAAEDQGELRNDTLHAFDAPHPRGGTPWLLLPRSQIVRRARVTERSRPLSSIALSRQGIRTGQNDVFILSLESAADDFARVRNGFGESAILETALLHPVIFGSEIQRYDIVRGARRLLYPYRQGALVEESEMETRFPRTWAYLQRYHDILSARSSLARSSLRWYELIRKRDVSWLSSPKLLIRDLAIDPAFALDSSGDTYLVGGTAVVPQSPELLIPLLGYLNSRPVGELFRQITPAFRGGFQKFEPRHLDSIPIPRRLLHESDEAGALAEMVSVILRVRASGDQAAEKETDRLIDSFINTMFDRPVEEDEVLDDEDAEDAPTDRER